LILTGSNAVLYRMLRGSVSRLCFLLVSLTFF